MLTFKRENWLEIRQNIFPIWKRHYDEIAGPNPLTLDPDWQKYDDYWFQGVLHIVGARNEMGELVGYLFSLIGPHLHYKSTRCAFLDLYWLEPQYRKGMNGVRLFREAEESLRALGVKKVFGQTKVWKDISVIFDRLGWKQAEITYTKVL
jgi:hypothetical protein